MTKRGMSESEGQGKGLSLTEQLDIIEGQPISEFSSSRGEQLGKVQLLDKLGLQANGDYKLVISIPELYVEAVKEWAHEAGISTEQWIENQMVAFLDNWAVPARGK
jgi:hypothetical protein